MDEKERRVELRAVVLVEGISDQQALEALAEHCGRDLDAEGIAVVPMGGASTIGRFLDLYGPQGRDVTLAGLCDAGEVGDFKRGLERAGLGADLTRAEMESLGFYVCDVDLEDELIRALGVDAVEQVVAAQGELGSFRTLHRQPAQRADPGATASALHGHPLRSEDPVRASPRRRLGSQRCSPAARRGTRTRLSHTPSLGPVAGALD